MISYWTSVGSSRNWGEETSKSSGRISSMKERSSSSVARRGSEAAGCDLWAWEMVEARSTGGRRYGS